MFPCLPEWSLLGTFRYSKEGLYVAIATSRHTVQDVWKESNHTELPLHTCVKYLLACYLKREESEHYKGYCHYTNLEYFWRWEINRPLIHRPLGNVASCPPPIVVLRTVKVLLAPREKFDGGEPLDPISAGHNGVHCGVQCSQLKLPLQIGGGLGPFRSQVLAMTTPINSNM